MWDFILFVLWIALFGIFAAMYIHEKPEGNGGIMRMKNAVVRTLLKSMDIGEEGRREHMLMVLLCSGLIWSTLFSGLLALLRWVSTGSSTEVAGRSLLPAQLSKETRCTDGSAELLLRGRPWDFVKLRWYVGGCTLRVSGCDTTREAGFLATFGFSV